MAEPVTSWAPHEVEQVLAEVQRVRPRPPTAAPVPIQVQATATASDEQDDQQPPQTITEPPPLAYEPRILDTFATTARAHIAGEERMIKLLYLVVTSRFLKRIVSVAVKGPSSSGKSYNVQEVLKFFPSSAFYALTSMSERALIYDQEPLMHRMLVIYEATGMSGEQQTYYIRSLLSEGKIDYVTVEKHNNKQQARRIYREGPTGLIVTTTADSLHPENETRLLSLTTNDTPNQTQAIMLATAAAEDHPLPVSYSPWLDLQEWLATTNHRVTIPYAALLAQSIPPTAVRLRRDFSTILSLIKSHALLHQAQRETNEQGDIIATVDDYAAVRDLVHDLIAEGVGHTVSNTLRETVEAVRALTATEGQTTLLHDGPLVTTTNAAVARALKLDKSAASRRITGALRRGYLINHETRKGQQMKLALGEPLPTEVEILPSATALAAAIEEGYL